MQYAKVENGRVVEQRPRPNWLDASGNPITDDARFRQDGIYPIVESPPAYDRDFQMAAPRKMSEWIVHADHVEKTWSVQEVSLQVAHRTMHAKIEAARLRNSAQMPWSIPSTGEAVTVNVQEDAPHKPRQTWLSGTILWAMSEIVAGNLQASDELIASDDSLHTLGVDDWLALGRAMKGWLRQHIEQERVHKAAVSQMTTVAQIMGYDETANWPAGVQ